MKKGVKYTLLGLVAFILITLALNLGTFVKGFQAGFEDSSKEAAKSTKGLRLK